MFIQINKDIIINSDKIINITKFDESGHPCIAFSMQGGSRFDFTCQDKAECNAKFKQLKSILYQDYRFYDLTQ